ncbi:MAG: PorV/PorQ family protein [Elusimicrobiales bacterium]|nr:PorV/PorQ family protein [Elusimicrobiales bacterium]
MKYKIWLSAALMLANTAAYASGPGTTGAAFLKVGVGARELALGSAASVLTEGANAANWNPGKLAEVKGKNLSASYNMLFIDESQGALAYATPLSGGSAVVGAGINYLTVSNIEKRASDTNTPDSKFSNNNMAFTLSYARPEVKPGLALGANLKYISQKLDTADDKAIALDLGSTYKVNDTWTAAFVMQNLGSSIGPDKLPLTFKGGAARSFLDGKLAAGADLDWLAQDERFYLSLGGEYLLNKNFAFRAGYQFGHSADKLGSGLVGLGAGIGLKFDRFALDYAYVPFGDLGDTHRMTLGFNF